MKLKYTFLLLFSCILFLLSCSKENNLDTNYREVEALLLKPTDTASSVLLYSSTKKYHMACPQGGGYTCGTTFGPECMFDQECYPVIETPYRKTNCISDPFATACELGGSASAPVCYAPKSCPPEKKKYISRPCGDPLRSGCFDLPGGGPYCTVLASCPPQ